MKPRTQTQISDGSPQTETVTREEMVRLLNEDLAREYQAIIAYVVYSQVLKALPIRTSRENSKSTRRRNWLTPSRYRGKLITSVECQRLRPRTSKLPKMPNKCSNSISKMSASPFKTTASASA